VTDDVTPPEPVRPPDRPSHAEPSDAVEQPPAPRPDAAVLTRSPNGAVPSPPVGPRAPEAPKQPFVEPSRSNRSDPQAAVDTREISLAALREAAVRAGASAARAPAPADSPAPADREGRGAAPGVHRHVDLVSVEEHEAGALRDAADEAAKLEAAGVGESYLDRGDIGHPGETEDVEDTSAPSPIDPRIRDRRVAVTRAEGRRRLRILLTAVSIASLIGIAWLAVQSPLLAVDAIAVKGTARESQAAVQAAAGVHTGSALLFVDTGAVARRVEALPWVAQAKVERHLPNGLTITVVERLPVAWARRPVPPGSPLGTLGAVVLVDRFGRVLGDEPAAPAGLPELIGMVNVPDRGSRIEPAAPAGAVAQLPDALRAQTGSVVRRRGQAVLQLHQPPFGAKPAADEVRLGNLDEIAAKGAAALAVLDQLGRDGSHVRYVDVRVPGAPATG
jgi:cell division protein FtsQ